MECILDSLNDTFNFSKYEGYTLADVLDLDPGFIKWAIKNTTFVLFAITDTAMEEVRKVYPEFITSTSFEESRQERLEEFAMAMAREELKYESQNDWENDGFDDKRSFGRYSGSWAQDVEGYSDEEIDIIFDGDSSAYWNID